MNDVKIGLQACGVIPFDIISNILEEAFLDSTSAISEGESSTITV